MQALSFARGYEGMTLASYRAKVMELLNVQAIRLANLLLLLKECSDGRGAAAKLSRLSGVPQPYISQLRRGALHSGGARRTMGDETARAFEAGMNRPSGWMDHDHSNPAADAASRLSRLAMILTPDQRQILLQTAEAFADGNGKPPPEDGPETRQPKNRRH